MIRKGVTLVVPECVCFFVEGGGGGGYFGSFESFLAEKVLLLLLHTVEENLRFFIPKITSSHIFGMAKA